MMTYHANLRIAALAAMIALGGTATLAQDGHAKMFDKIDANSDGQVTAEEMAAHAQARFDTVDTDGDGFLTAEEMRAGHTKMAKGHGDRDGKRAARMIEKFDANADGALDAAELQTAFADRRARKAQHFFKRMDSDKDGKISFDEMHGKRDPSAMIKKLDADGNGSLSAEEFAKAKRHGGKGKRHHGKHD